MNDANEWRRQLDALSQQYWNAWSSLGANAAPAAAASPVQAPWAHTLEFWNSLANPQGTQAQATVERFGRQAQDYLELMRTAAERLQPGAGAGDIATAWRDALAAATGGNPLLAALQSLGGEGARGVQQLADGAEALLAPLRAQYQSLLDLPAFGQHREQQERLQRSAREHMDLQQAAGRYAAILQESSQQAFVLFERKLAERSAPGKQLDSARALYDLWIDAAEEAYAAVATSPRFGHAYAELANAQMRVRRSAQAFAEQAGTELGLPTRTELDSAHRRVHAMQRELRELRARLDAFEAAATSTEPAQAQTTTPPSRRTAPARKAAPAGKAAPAKKAATPKKPAGRSRRPNAATATPMPRPAAPKHPAGSRKSTATRGKRK